MKVMKEMDSLKIEMEEVERMKMGERVEKKMIENLKEKIEMNKEYIRKNGEEMKEIREWKWKWKR